MATDLENYIRNAAIQRGIDPDIALRVAKSEGGLKDPTRQSDVRKNGLREPSYGPFQLLVGGGNTGFPTGMGNDFVAKYGMSPGDPAAAYKGIDFALDNARDRGWGAWYGAKAQGITGKMGIGGAPSGGAPMAPPRSVASVADGPKGQENYVAFGSIGPTNTSDRPESAPIAPQPTAIPGAVIAQSQGQTENKQGKLNNLFGLLAQVSNQQEQAAPQVQFQGPSQQQSQALNQVLQSLRSRLI